MPHDRKPRGRFVSDEFGRYRRLPDTAGMRFPVRCRTCGGVYDMGAVTVIARYADCSVWKAPCCGRTADSRVPEGGIEKLY